MVSKYDVNCLCICRCSSFRCPTHSSAEEGWSQKKYRTELRNNHDQRPVICQVQSAASVLWSHSRIHSRWVLIRRSTGDCHNKSSKTLLSSCCYFSPTRTLSPTISWVRTDVSVRWMSQNEHCSVIKYNHTKSKCINFRKCIADDVLPPWQWKWT